MAKNEDRSPTVPPRTGKAVLYQQCGDPLAAMACGGRNRRKAEGSEWRGHATEQDVADHGAVPRRQQRIDNGPVRPQLVDEVGLI